MSDDRGSVTAELAVGLVSLVLVLAAVLGVVRAGVVRLACVDAARAGARAAALAGPDGDAGASAAAAARRVAPGAAVRVTVDGEWVQVRVESVLLDLPVASRVLASGSATAQVEP